MKPLKFYINGIQIKEPENWGEFEETFVRDETARHVYFDYPISLEFIGDEYALLDSIYQESYDSQSTFQVYEKSSNSEDLIFTSFIKTSNITFDLVRKIAIVEIDDVVYQAFIFNNYSVEVGCGTDVSKNGESIDGIESLDFRPFDPTTGDFYNDSRRAYDVNDVFQMVVDYISDGNVGFESSWYDDLPNGERYCIVTGIELRNATGRTAPIVSLESIFNELWKKYNLYLIVENPITNPVIRLEEESYLYGESNIEIINIANLNRSIDFERLYSTINIGSNTFIQERSLEFLFPYFRLFSFVNETFNISGVVNVDNALDLVSDFIIDTNVIQDVLVNDSDAYDEEIFIIQYETAFDSGTGEPIAFAKRGFYFDSPNENARFYNEQLLNSNVAARFQYLGNLVLQTGAVDTAFKATQNESISFIRSFDNPPQTLPVVGENGPIDWQFQDDSTGSNFDIGDNYDPTTGIFTAPQDGEYVFFVRIRIRTAGGGNNPPGLSENFVLTPDFWVSVEDDIESKPSSYFITKIFNNGSSDLLNIDYDSDFTIGIGPNTTLVDFFQTRTMNEGSEAKVKVQLLAFNEGTGLFNVAISESMFELVSSPLAGGTFQVKDPDDYYINILDAESILIPRDQWDSFREDVTQGILISESDKLFRLSYSKTIRRKFISGESDIKTVFNRKQPVI